jgi:hypothetical protein
LMLSASATEDPPNFWTIKPMAAWWQRWCKSDGLS